MTRRLVDNDTRRENLKQQRMLLMAERRFGRMFGRVLRELSAEMVEAFALTGTAPRLPDNAEQRIAAVFIDMAQVMTDAFGSRVLEQGKAAGHDLEVKGFAEFFQRVALEYIAQEAIRRRITSIAETTRNQIVRQVVAGQTDGLGVAEIASNIAGTVRNMSTLRGALIARTETHGAANHAADQAARATGLNLMKEWVAVNDHRTRDGDDEWNHREMDGEIVAMDEPFRFESKNGAVDLLRFPGDPNGSPGNCINCRCSVAHVVIE